MTVVNNQEPKTIRELQQWYTDNNLPPESVTRFFIGKNIQEPRAFGIYESKPGYFIVYKNKASGERKVRYEGTDEAYAVQELLNRLKEEILHQKRVARAKQSTGGALGVKDKHVDKPVQNKKDHGCLIIATALIGAICAVIAALSWIVVAVSPLDSGYYSSTEDGQLYCFEYREWWKYYPEINDWVYLRDYDGRSNDPEGVSRKTKIDSLSDYDSSIPRIYDSRDYKDRHHLSPYVADNGNYRYYEYNGIIWVYLDDQYYNYGDNNNDYSGWYIYDSDTDSYDYYCSGDDKEALGEDLWYDADDYEINNDVVENNQSISDFNDSTYYDYYEDHVEAYDAYRQDSATYNTTTDNDDDYSWGSDWDTGDWDTGATDWDSDW